VRKLASVVLVLFGFRPTGIRMSDVFNLSRLRGCLWL